MSRKAWVFLTLFLVLWMASLACSQPQTEKERIDRQAAATREAAGAAQPIAAAAKKGIPPVPGDTPSGPTSVPTLNPSCTWVLLDTTPALATGGGDPNMKAEWDGNEIETRYKHAGNFGCDEQAFVTSHEWESLPEELFPGKEILFSVKLAWSLEGTPECSSLTAGAKTYLMAGTTVVEIAQSNIIVSSEPDGYLDNSGIWTVPSGKDGDMLTIKAHGSSGSLGGTISYHYEMICSSP